MTGQAEQDHPVANPDRTVLKDDAPREPTKEERASDQPWPEVAEEVKEAVEHADGPFD